MHIIILYTCTCTYSTCRRLTTHIRDVEKGQDGSSSNKEGHAENGGIDINILHYSVGGDKEDSECDGGYVHSCSHGFGVVQTFDLHTACGKRQKQRQNLQTHEPGYKISFSS